MKKKDLNRKLNHAADVMMVAYGSKSLFKELGQFEGRDDELRAQSEIESVTVYRFLHSIFGEITPKTLFFGRGLGVYLDLDMMGELNRTMRRLKRDTDDRLETLYTLRDLGAYFTYLASNMNSGMIGYKQSLKLLTAAVAIYDVCQKLAPYVFDDVCFEDDSVIIPMRRRA